MKLRHLFFSFVILSVFFTLIVHPTKGKAPSAQDFALTDIDGNEFSLSDYRGHVIIVDFMATWCSTCIEDVKNLKSLYNFFEKDIVMISISIDPLIDTDERLEKFKEIFNIEWILSRDVIGLSVDYSVLEIPTLIVIDKNLQIRHMHVGLTDTPILKGEIVKILGSIPIADELNTSIYSMPFLGAAIFAFSAGIFSLLNPCGFALLPAYLFYGMGANRSLKEAFQSGIMATSGMMTILFILGIIASTLGAIIIQYFTPIQIVVALFIIIMGLIMLTNISLPSFIRKKILVAFSSRIAKSKGFFGMYTFGLGYALGNFCAAPIFFSLLIYLTSIGLLKGALILILYSFGMGTVLVVISILGAKAKDTLVKKMHSIISYTHIISGFALIIFGSYLLYQSLSYLSILNF